MRLIAALRLAQSASDAMDAAFADFVGLNHTDARCLDFIDQAEQMTAGELARKVGLTTGAVTAVVDRLEAAGLVRRIRDTEDRRKVFLEATEEAKRLGSEIYGPIAEAGLPYIRQLSDEEMARVFNLGIGMVAVVPPDDVARALALLRDEGHTAAEIGRLFAAGAGDPGRTVHLG